MKETERKDEKSKFLPYYEKWLTTETTKRAVTRQMRYSLNLFRDFLGDSDPCFDNITMKFIENFIEWMAKKGLKANTRGSHIKRIKTAMGEAFDAGLHNSREFEKFRVEKEQVENIYLSEEEIRKIEELLLFLFYKVEFSATIKKENNRSAVFGLSLWHDKKADSGLCLKVCRTKIHLEGVQLWGF